MSSSLTFYFITPPPRVNVCKVVIIMFQWKLWLLCNHSLTSSKGLGKRFRGKIDSSVNLEWITGVIDPKLVNKIFAFLTLLSKSTILFIYVSGGPLMHFERPLRQWILVGNKSGPILLLHSQTQSCNLCQKSTILS